MAAKSVQISNSEKRAIKSIEATLLNIIEWKALLYEDILNFDFYLRQIHKILGRLEWLDISTRNWFYTLKHKYPEIEYQRGWTDIILKFLETQYKEKVSKVIDENFIESFKILKSKLTGLWE